MGTSCTPIGYLEIRVEQIGVERRLYVSRADESVLIGEDLLSEIELGKASPEVSYGDGILTIRAVNGTVSYGVGKRLTWTRAYVGHRSGPADGRAADSD